MEKKIINTHKKKLFELYWDSFGIFFCHIIPHQNLKIGTRGLIENEKKNGILLIFGQTSTKNLSFEEHFLYAQLQFGAKWENLEIPWSSILAFYDKEQISITQLQTTNETLPKKTKQQGNIIEVDFGKK